MPCACDYAGEGLGGSNSEWGADIRRSEGRKETRVGCGKRAGLGRLVDAGRRCI